MTLKLNKDEIFMSNARIRHDIIIGENITRATSSDTPGIKRDLSQAREVIKDKKRNLNLPIGPAAFLANVAAGATQRFLQRPDLPTENFNVNHPGTAYEQNTNLGRSEGSSTNSRRNESSSTSGNSSQELRGPIGKRNENENRNHGRRTEGQSQNQRQRSNPISKDSLNQLAASSYEAFMRSRPNSSTHTTNNPVDQRIARRQQPYYSSSANPRPNRGMGEAILDFFCGPVYAETIQHNQSPELTQYSLDNAHNSRWTFRLPSFLPESHPNPFLKAAYKIGRGIEKTRDGIVDAVVHPYEMLENTSILVWDVAGAASRVVFGTCTEGSKNRNRQRWEGIKTAYKEFNKSDVPTQLGMGTEIVLPLIFSGLTGAGAVSAYGRNSNLTKLKNQTPNQTPKSQYFPDSNLLPVITQKGLNRIDAHLNHILSHQNLHKELQIGERTMLQRLRLGNRTPQDMEFYLHELKESTIFRQTGNLRSSHESSLQWRKVTERDLFHQSVINANKELFPIKWRENYEFNSRSSKPNI